MALNFFYQLQTITFTHNLQKIIVTCENDIAEVTLTDNNSNVKFSNTYHPYNQSFTIYNLDDIINAILEKNSPVMQFTLAVKQNNESISMTFTAIYSTLKILIPAENWIKSKFLTTTTSKITNAKCSEHFALFTQDVEPIRITGLAVDINNELFPFSFDLGNTVQNEITNISMSCETILEKIESATIIKAYTLIVGQRSLAFYVEESNARKSWDFLFKNCFGVQELISLGGITTTKHIVNVENAHVNKSLVQYDRKAIYSYETEAIVDDSIANFIPQFFASHDICLVEDSTSIGQIIITESSCEISNEFSAINKVKFTWRFSQDIPIYLFTNNLREIFSNQYDVQYD